MDRRPNNPSASLYKLKKDKKKVTHDLHRQTPKQSQSVAIRIATHAQTIPVRRYACDMSHAQTRKNQNPAASPPRRGTTHTRSLLKHTRSLLTHTRSLLTQRVHGERYSLTGGPLGVVCGVQRARGKGKSFLGGRRQREYRVRPGASTRHQTGSLPPSLPPSRPPSLPPSLHLRHPSIGTPILKEEKIPPRSTDTKKGKTLKKASCFSWLRASILGLFCLYSRSLLPL
jgi:hypothetical protein